MTSPIGRMMVDKMTLRVAHVLAACLLASCAHSDPEPQSDLSAFFERRDNCDHFRGEIPDDMASERGKEVERALHEYCSGTDAELQRLKERYANNATVMARLATYEENIE